MTALLIFLLELWRDGFGGGGMNRNAIGPQSVIRQGGP